MSPSANAVLLLDWIPRQRDRWLDLYLAGRVFGGRAGESPLTLTDGAFDGDAARLDFADGESLVIRTPSGFLTADGTLTVPTATEVRFAWHAYGADRTGASRCELVYRLADGEVSVAATGPATAWQGSERFPLGNRPMVRLA